MAACWQRGTPAAIGSIKANIGHTKAAAGVAGLLKAVAALESQVIPPTTGCDEPHAELAHDGAALRVLGRFMHRLPPLGVGMSPQPSEYGVSPMTAMPTVAPLVAEPSSAYDTRPGTTASRAWRR